MIIDSFFLLVALLLPCFLGFAIVRPFLKKRYGYIAFALGSGYLIGWFVVTIILRIYLVIDRSPNIKEIVLIECLIFLPLLLLKSRDCSIGEFRLERAPSHLAYGFTLVTVFLLCYRLGVTTLDLVGNPSFLLDKKLSGELSSQISYQVARSSQEGKGMGALLIDLKEEVLLVLANHRTYFTSLIQNYVAISGLAWGSAVVKLPWVGLSIATALIAFGGLRYLGSRTLPALFASYAIVSLPIWDAHVSLGYSIDIWIAATFLATILLQVKLCQYGEWRLLFPIGLFLLLSCLVSSTAYLLFFVSIALLLWHLIGGWVASLLFAFLSLLLYLKGNWVMDKIYEKMHFLSSQVVIEEKNTDFMEMGWVKWSMENNWHYIFVIALFSLVLFVFNKRHEQSRGFILLVTTGVVAALTLLMAIWGLQSFSDTVLEDYSGKVILHFIPVFALMPVCVFHLITEDELSFSSI